MVVIIAALNLPYSVEFEELIPENSERDPLHQLPFAHQYAQSIVRGQAQEEAETARLRAEVPFDFADDDRKNRLMPSPQVPDTAIPQKSIVDTRKPVDKKAPITVNVKVPSSKRTPEHVDTPAPPHSRRKQPERSPSPASRLRSGRRRVSSHPTTQFDTRPWSVVEARSANRGIFNAVDRAVAMHRMEKPKCVGLLGMPTDALPSAVKVRISRQLQDTRACYPVYVSDTQIQGHYENYCKEFLWPTFHCQIPDIPTSKAYEDHSWGDYVAVNQAVANKIVEVYEPGDIVWVHDYHLMLVPEMVKNKVPHAAIGFFMHVAFPTSEVFRCLAYRAPLLRGLLASNVVTFQIHEYMQHFVMTAARILAVDTSLGRIETEDHDVMVQSCPIGIDVEHLDAIALHGDTGAAMMQHRSVIRKRWPTQKVIAARDKYDPIRGLSLKLRAFDLFLQNNPEYADKVVLVQICLPTTGSNFETDDDLGLGSLADHINSKYGDLAAGIQPVVLLRQDVRFEQYLALLAEADGFVISCLREGMNLTCHEYTYVNQREGPLILSEFTGSASVFGHDALLVNPWNLKQLANSFKQCVEMPPAEKQHRSQALTQKVTSHTGIHWAELMVESIERSWREDMARTCMKPDVALLRSLYHEGGGQRVFLLEIESPANSLLHQPHGSYYSQRLPLVLRALTEDPRNVVYVLSAESRSYMERLYRQLPDVGLIAEYGRYIRTAGEWIDLGPTESTDANRAQWQEAITPLVQRMEERDLVSNISVHESSIVVDLKPAAEDDTDGREHLSTLGEYTSVINDTFADSGVRCKLENNQLTIYTSNVGRIRLRAFHKVIESFERPLALLMVANQAYTTNADDIVYAWAEDQKKAGKTRNLVTTVLGKHPAYAHCMVEGVNALLNLLQAMSSL